MRSKGEGSLYQRPDGQWVAQIEDGYYPNGRRRYRRRVRSTRQRALDVLHQLQRDSSRRIDGDLSRQTLGGYLDGWLDGLEGVRAPKTLAAYQADCHHVTSAIGHVRLDQLEADHVRRMLAGLIGQLAPKSRLNVRTTLHTAVEAAVVERRLDWNPVSVVPRPRVPVHDIHPLTRDQAARLLEAVDGTRLGPLWSLSVAVGLRLAEALGLTWRRVDTSAGVVRIRHQLRRLDGHYVLDDLKNRKVRDVPLPGFAARALADHRRAIAAERLAAPAWPDGCCADCRSTGWGLVFPSIAGRGMTDTVPRNELGATTADLFGRNVNPHDLRHTAATLMIAQGVPLSIVSDILGHSSIQVTKDLYGHLDVDQLRPGAEAMDGLLG